MTQNGKRYYEHYHEHFEPERSTNTSENRVAVFLLFVI